MKRKAIIESLRHRHKDADYNRHHLSTSEARFIEEGKFQAYSVAMRMLGEEVSLDGGEVRSALRKVARDEEACDMGTRRIRDMALKLERFTEENPHAPIIEIDDETNTATIRQAPPPTAMPTPDDLPTPIPEALFGYPKKRDDWDRKTRPLLAFAQHPPFSTDELRAMLHGWQKFNATTADDDIQSTTPKFIRLYNKDQHVASAAFDENLGAHVAHITDTVTVTDYKLYNGAGICIRESTFDPVCFVPQGPAIPLDALTIECDDDTPDDDDTPTLTAIQEATIPITPKPPTPPHRIIITDSTHRVLFNGYAMLPVHKMRGIPCVPFDELIAMDDPFDHCRRIEDNDGNRLFDGCCVPPIKIQRVPDDEPAYDKDGPYLGVDKYDDCSGPNPWICGKSLISSALDPLKLPTPTTPQVECFGVLFDMRYEDKEYTIYHPNYPHVYADGPTKEEAFENLVTCIHRRRRLVNRYPSVGNYHERCFLNDDIDIDIPYPDFPPL